MSQRYLAGTSGGTTASTEGHGGTTGIPDGTTAGTDNHTFCAVLKDQWHRNDQRIWK